ncbi:hypothetical protein DFH08DRAFT_871384 [Mycena albidolilacea]|uniref:Uncharacterized protein n=1 Tax=Mycena albidolilacea TaxID=1033008 RepID=A0AAD6ZY79_9AGAR|nr:hypothetical protein DFH08DRAFT_871384 [Mycena albidolilacea]
MTSFTNAASGTELSVPAATSPDADANTVAALQNMINAMATLSQASQAQPLPPHTAPAPTVAQAAVPAATPAQVPAGFRTRGPWIAGALFIVVPPEHLMPIPEAPIDSEADSPVWYCITKGKYIGITLSNPLALAAVVGVSGSRMKAYKTQVLALEAFNEMLDYRMVAVVA